MAAFYVLLRMYIHGWRKASLWAISVRVCMCSDDAPVVAHQAAERSGAAWCLYEYDLMRGTVHDAKDTVVTPMMRRAAPLRFAAWRKEAQRMLDRG